MSLYIPTSAGERFGTVLRARQVGEFMVRVARFDADLRMPAHHHPLAYFTYVARGGLEEHCGTRDLLFESGSVHFHPRLEPHAARTSPAGATCMSVVPLGLLADRIESEEASARRGAPPTGLRWPAARCYLALIEGDDLSDLSVEAAALELVAAHLRQNAMEPLARKPRWLEGVRNHLDRSYAGPIRLSELAALAGIHEVYLVRAFRRHMGVTPAAYVRRLRIEAARIALLTSARPIAEIALASGFSSQAHLTRAFHAALGIPPAAYRRRYGQRRT